MIQLFNNILQINIRKEVSELYVSAAIKTFAISMVAIFEPIFLYKIFNSIQWVLFFYLLMYLVYFFLLPLGGKMASRYGFEHCILFSVPLLILYLLALYQISNFPILFYIAPVILALYHAVYWPAHHTDMAHYINPAQRGTEVSIIYSLMSFIGIIGPIMGGFIIALFGFKVLFLIVGIIMFASAIPLFMTKEEFTPMHFSYFKAMYRFFKSYDIYTTKAKLTFMGYGADVIELICWPIFIFLVIQDYKIMGILITLSLFISAVIILIIGKTIDKKAGDKVLKTSVILSFFLWIFRYFFATTAGVFTIDFLHKNIGNGIFLPIRTFTYSEGKKRGFLKYVIFSEMVLSFAKALTGFCLIILLSFIHSWFIIFFTAGILTLFYLFLPYENGY